MSNSIDNPADNFEPARIKELENLKARGYETQNLVGLALSGGGIRSSTFCLGVLQALARFDQKRQDTTKGFLERVHFLSTVSGGGYIGSALTWLLHKIWGDHDFDMKKFFPFNTSENNPNKQVNKDVLRFLRRNRNFIFPGAGMGPGAAMAVMGLGWIVNALVYLPFPWVVLFWLNAIPDLDICGLVVIPGFAVIPLVITVLLVMAYLAMVALYVARVCFKSHESKQRFYPKRRGFSITAGKALKLAGIFAAIGAIPFIGKFFELETEELWKAGGLAAVLGGLSASSSQMEKVKKSIGQISTSLLASVGSAAVLYGLVVFLYVSSSICYEATTGPDRNAIVMASQFVLLLVSFIIMFRGNVNYFSLHRFYRDRLMETFMPDWGPVFGGEGDSEMAKNADETPISAVWKDKMPVPLHLVNTNLILVDSPNKRYRARGGDNFVLSPLLCGSAATGWVETKKFMKDRMMLSTAMAVSAAAVSPSTGVGGEGLTRNFAVSLLMSLLNIRLGYAIPNPLKNQGVRTNFIHDGFKTLGHKLREDESTLQISDGGHFENMAVYELIRRKAKLILAVDAGADEEYSSGDLANLMEKARTDFGVGIRFDKEGEGDYPLSALRPKKQDGYDLKVSEKGYAKAKIIYPDGEGEGTLIYIKLSLPKDLPEELYGYKRIHLQYPHESTGDQFFDEKQFEAYRELGYQITKVMTNDEKFVQESGL